MKALHVMIAIFLSGTFLYAQPIELSGTLISDHQKSISSRYMGFVQEIYVEEGSVVKKGDPLYLIDSKEIDSAKAQVELGIEQAKLNAQMLQSQYANASLNLERHKRLLEKEMVSRYDVENLQLLTDNLRAMLAIAQKQVSQAEQKLLEVKHQYAYLRVEAPSDGVVIAKQIKVGEMALPGVPAIVLSDATSLNIRVDVSENHVSFLKKGDTVAIRIPSVGYQGEGTIRAIIPSANPMSHTFGVKIAFTPSKSMIPGMYAEVVFKGREP